MLRALRYESETCWFLLFGVLDYLMTYTLLYAAVITGETVVETNALAAPLLDRYGEHGLLAFKSGMALFICGGVQIIATRRPVTARRLLLFGCSVLAAVVLYQTVLLLVVMDVMPLSEQFRSLVTIGG